MTDDTMLDNDDLGPDEQTETDLPPTTDVANEVEDLEPEPLSVNDQDEADDGDLVLDDHDGDDSEAAGDDTDTPETIYKAIYDRADNPLTDDPDTAEKSRLVLSRQTLAELDGLLSAAWDRHIADPKNQQLEDDYKLLVEYARRLSPAEPYLHEAFEDEAHWVNRYRERGAEAGGRTLSFVKNKRSQAIKGERAIAYASGFAMDDQPYQIPCWHSGFYISINAPTVENVIELETKIQLKRIDYGRRTHGLIFAAESIYLEEAVMDLALSLIIGTTYPGGEELYRVIDQRDHPIIAAHLLHLMYPHGAPFKDDCLNPNKDCTYSRNVLLHFDKAVRVKYEALTEFGRQHMTQRKGLMKLADIEQYRQELNSRIGNTVLLSDGRVRLTLTAPTTEEAFTVTDGWIDSIVKRTNELFTNQFNNREYSNYIGRQAKAAELASYAHWVTQIDLIKPDGGVDSFITDKKTIIAMLARWSNNPDLRTQCIEGISSFIAKSSFVFFGVPRFDCPSCHYKKPGNEHYPEIVPLEIFDLFFILAPAFTMRGTIGV